MSDIEFLAIGLLVVVALISLLCSAFGKLGGRR